MCSARRTLIVLVAAAALLAASSGSANASTGESANTAAATPRFATDCPIFPVCEVAKVLVPIAASGVGAAAGYVASKVVGSKKEQSQAKTRAKARAKAHKGPSAQDNVNLGRATRRVARNNLRQIGKILRKVYGKKRMRDRMPEAARGCLVGGIGGVLISVSHGLEGLKRDATDGCIGGAMAGWSGSM